MGKATGQLRLVFLFLKTQREFDEFGYTVLPLARDL